MRKNNFDFNSDTQWLKEFSDHVFKELNLDGWKLDFFPFSFDGDWCYNDLKTIEMDMSTGSSWFYLKQRFLHEVAHALDERSCKGRTSDSFHDSYFFKTYGELLIRFADYDNKNKDKY
jgi:hypothetical protein